ncbi:MAG TPA: iron ABC transporter permease [Candidatus Hydrogenedentes bacterium]|nr:iron ABC transporter permease [Candidatus Hydrogenedentota bacterium]
MTRRVSAGHAVLAATALCVIVIAASLSIGPEPLGPLHLLRQWRAGESIEDAAYILFSLRLPRTLAAFLAGAGLALVGCAFQALLRNPLATPYTLGLAGAGSFGAYTALVLIDFGRLPYSVIGVPMVQAFAFLFAAADVLLIFLVASRRARPTPAVLLLTGVTLGIIANSGIMLTRYFARPERLIDMDRWLMGGVDIVGYRPVAVLAIGVVPACLWLLTQAGKLDQFGFSEEMAAGRGVNITRLQLTVLLLGSFITGVIVSEVGPIGFVGLVVPHTVRAFTGAGHRLLMPVSLLSGGAFLCLCDLAARKVPVAGEIPIGIITTLIGGPFFLYLLVRGRFADWET